MTDQKELFATTDKPTGRKMEIVLPVPLPTWNRIIEMDRWLQKKLRDLLHLFVSLSIQYGEDWPTQTVFQEKLCSTELLKLEYLQTIRPNKSRKSYILKLKAELKKRS